MLSEYEIKLADKDEIDACLNCQKEKCDNCLDRLRKRISKINENGKPKYHIWTEEELTYLQEHIFYTSTELAKELGMTVAMVNAKKKRLKKGGKNRGSCM